MWDQIKSVIRSKNLELRFAKLKIAPHHGLHELRNTGMTTTRIRDTFITAD
jgi:hypothetical protein